uniref:Nucleoporin NSP1-like C-terminal domain-containing protein n=1 Tax=Ciona savignyi TaxID=51511 RepID=H2Y823_CIOSA
SFGTPANTFSFGQNQAAPATQAAPASTGFSFGGGATQQTPSLFGGATSAPASASTGFSFASTQSSAPSFGAAQPTSGFTAPATQSGFSLGGNVPKPSFGATTAATGFSFGGGGATSASTAPATSAPTFGAQPATTGGLFGAQPSKPPSFGLGVATPAKTSSATGFSTTSTNQQGGWGSTGFNLGGTSTTVTTSTASSGFKLGSTGTTEFKLGGTTSFNLTPASSQPTAPSSTTLVGDTTTPSLRYKDLETRINKWTNELEQQEQLFLTQATQVNAWNKLLIDNSGKITDLNDEFEKVKLDQERLDQEIDFIRTQQQELEDLLLPLEEKTRQEVSTLAGAVHTHHADLERERTYNLAENIDAQLKQMVQDLREVIDHINVTSQPSDTTDPVNQIAKILSAHMDSLQWLDSNSVALQQKFTQLGKEINDRKMEQESRFRLAFD